MTACAGLAVPSKLRPGCIEPLDIAWLSARPEYWPSHGQGEPPNGVACLLFAVGAGGAGWLTRLAESGWFVGLEPRAEDLAGSGVPRGRWTVPAGAAGSGARVTDRVTEVAEAFFASEPFPAAWYAAVAVPREARPAELSSALGLVSALRERRDPLGRRLTVVATVEASLPQADAFAQRLLDRGAFVVRGGMGAASDHLHHFPLRATVAPRRGRLICVDLADYLHTWRPGRAAGLHVVPFGSDAVQALRRVPVLAGIRALNLGFHLAPGARGNALAEIDRLATLTRELLLGPEGDMVFTDTDRLDGRTDSTDLLVIHDASVGGCACCP